MIPTLARADYAGEFAAAVSAARGHLAAQEGFSPEHIHVEDVKYHTFHYLKKTYIIVRLTHGEPHNPPLYVVAYDIEKGIIGPDYNALLAADVEAYRAKYGKLWPDLYELLPTLTDEELAPIAVWTMPHPEERSEAELIAEIVARYPEAADALEAEKFVWEVDDPALSQEILQAYRNLQAVELARRNAPIIVWLQDRGYEILGEIGPSVAAEVTKQDILALTKLDAVAVIFWGGSTAEPAAPVD